MKWKTPTLEAIKNLQDARIIEEEKKGIDSDKRKRKHRPLKNGSKELQKPIALGQEILKILSIADGYKKSLSKLKQTVNERVFCMPPECLYIQRNESL